MLHYLKVDFFKPRYMLQVHIIFIKQKIIYAIIWHLVNDREKYIRIEYSLHKLRETLKLQLIIGRNITVGRYHYQHIDKTIYIFKILFKTLILVCLNRELMWYANEYKLRRPNKYICIFTL